MDPLVRRRCGVTDGEEEGPSTASSSGSGEVGSTRREVVLQRSSDELLATAPAIDEQGRRR